MAKKKRKKATRRTKRTSSRKRSTGKRPLKVLTHFYRKTERRQRELKSLIERRGGKV